VHNIRVKLFVAAQQILDEGVRIADGAVIALLGGIEAASNDVVGHHQQLNAAFRRAPAEHQIAPKVPQIVQDRFKFGHELGITEPGACRLVRRCIRRF